MKSRNIGETTLVCVAMLGLPMAVIGALWWHGWLLAASAVAGDPEPEGKRAKLRAVK